MACETITVIPNRFTAGDTIDPISVKWNVAVTTETSEIAIDRPSPSASITIAGVLTDAATGTFEFPWSAGDLVAGEAQLVKARFFDTSGKRRSTEHFKINVDEDIS